MAVTKIWPIRTSISKPINYVMNADKTENPLFSQNIISEESYQALEDVIEYAANEDKTEQKYFVTTLGCNKRCFLYSKMGQRLPNAVVDLFSIRLFTVIRQNILIPQCGFRHGTTELCIPKTKRPRGQKKDWPCVIGGPSRIRLCNSDADHQNQTGYPSMTK